MGVRKARGDFSRGFSLLEVVLCLGLMATVLLGAFRILTQNLELHTESVFVTQAMEMAGSRISLIRARDILIPGISSGDFGSDFPGYQYEEEVSPVRGVAHLFRVHIRILRTDPVKKRNEEIVTYVFCPETQDAHQGNGIP